MRGMILSFLCAAGAIIGQERSPRPDPKPDYPPSYQVHISPTTKKEAGASTTSAPDYWIARGFDLRAVIARLYQVEPSRVDVPISLDDAKRYDFAVVLPMPESAEKIRDLVQLAIQDQFQLAITHESRPMDVFAVTAPSGKAPALKVALEASSKDSVSRLSVEDDRIQATGITMDQFCRVLEQRLEHPVVDRTNLTDRYDFEVRGSGSSREEFLRMLHDQLGLVVTPDRRDIEMLVVRRR